MYEYSIRCWRCVFFKVLFLSELLIISWKLCLMCASSLLGNSVSKRCKKHTHFVLPAVALPQLVCAVHTPETLLGNYSTVIFTPQTWPLLFLFCFVLFFRVVKEEISDDSAKLPCFNGRVVSWVNAKNLHVFSFMYSHNLNFLFSSLYRVGESLIRLALLFTMHR